MSVRTTAEMDRQQLALLSVGVNNLAGIGPSYIIGCYRRLWPCQGLGIALGVSLNPVFGLAVMFADLSALDHCIDGRKIFLERRDPSVPSSVFAKNGRSISHCESEFDQNPLRKPLKTDTPTTSNTFLTLNAYSG